MKALSPRMGLLALTALLGVSQVALNPTAHAFGRPKPQPNPTPTPTATTRPNPFTDETATRAVKRGYRAILWREADEGGLKLHKDILLRDGLSGWGNVLNAFATSPEFIGNVRPVRSDEEILGQIYRNLLLREPDPVGRSIYLPLIQSGQTGKAAEGIGQSDEFLEALKKPDAPPFKPVPGRLKAQGRRIVYPSGERFPWRFVSYFGGVAMLAQGREAELRDKLKWFAERGVTGVRTFAMMDRAGSGSMFELHPATGRQHLGRYLQIANEYGLYVEIVALANTKRWVEAGFDMADHLRKVGAIAAQHPNSIVEMSNEAIHPTHVDGLEDKLVGWRGLIPAGVLTATGISNESYYFNKRKVVGDYVTVHSDRASGEGGWRWVRHIKELGVDIGDIVNRPVVNDEPLGANEINDPGRRSNVPAHFYGMAVVGRVTENAGNTFHFEGGLRYSIPTGVQEKCFNAWMAGEKSIPSQPTLTFKNARWSDSPVSDANFEDDGRMNSATRVYSGITGNKGWAVVVRKVGDPGIRWANGWRPVSAVEPYAGVQLIQIAR